MASFANIFLMIITQRNVITRKMFGIHHGSKPFFAPCALFVTSQLRHTLITKYFLALLILSILKLENFDIPNVNLASDDIKEYHFSFVM